MSATANRSAAIAAAAVVVTAFGILLATFASAVHDRDEIRERLQRVELRVEVLEHSPVKRR